MGGHLTHGSPINISGTYFNIVSYGVDAEKETIDYQQVMEIAHQAKPKMIVVGASAYPRTIDYKAFKVIADSVSALLMVDMAHIAGLIAAGLHPSPVPYADFVTTTTHKTLRGPRGGMILCNEEWAARIDRAVFPGIQGGPLMHVIAAKAVCLKEAMTDEFLVYQKRVVENAAVLADELTKHGFRLVSGGTDTHLMLVDVRKQGLNGKQAEQLLEEVNITVNKNAIPFDPEKPTITSGIRIGTPAVTSRGLQAEDMVEMAQAISWALNERDESSKTKARAIVDRLCSKYPLYGD